MEQGVVDSPITLVIKAPNQKYNDQTINCFLNWTVKKLKAHLSHVYPSKPSSKDQRLVYSGKLLLDHLKLRDVLRKEDEYHMVHLVCASRTPPGSPQPHRRSSHSKSQTSSSTSSTTTEDSSNSPSPGQNSQSASTGGSSDGLRHRIGPTPNYTAHPAFMQGYMWTQFPPQQGLPVGMPAYAMYNPQTLFWWQQVYARQYYMHYQALASSSRSPRPDPSARADQPIREERRAAPPNGQGGEGLNEEELNRDWLDWVYTVARVAILLSVVYFYSSFSRFVMVMGAMLLLYLHQAGWLPFNLENELQNLADGANQEEMDGELQNDLQEMERIIDEGLGDEEGDSGEEGIDDPHGGAHASFLSSAWSFITTFFTSLIPEGLPNAAN